MTIQVGVPGAAGGGGGGGPSSEIQQAGGRVTVESDGSITLEPVAGQKVIRLLGVANNSAPLLEWDDGVGSPDFFVGVETGAGDHMSDTGVGSKIIASVGALHIGIDGEVSSFDITNSGVEMKAPRWLLTAPGPHAWGQAFAGNDRQFEFAGAFTGGGFSAQIRKFLIDGNLIAAPGDTEGMFGLQVNPLFQTQVTAEDVALIASIDIPIPTINDVLGGANVITRTAGLHVEGAAAEGVSNFAILVDAGLTQLDLLHLLGVGPHAFGQSFVSTGQQFQFSGAFTAQGSDPTKMLIANRVTGVSGAQRYRGLQLGVSFTTQAAEETILNMTGLEVAPPAITDLLTLTGTIAQAETVRITGAPTAGDVNFALIVEAGNSQMQQLQLLGALLVSGNGVFTGAQVSLSNAGDPNVLIQRTGGADLLLRAVGITHALVGCTTADELRLITSNTERVILEAGGAMRVLGDLDHEGSAVGFYNIGAISQQTGVAVSSAAIHAALVALGLITA